MAKQYDLLGMIKPPAKITNGHGTSPAMGDIVSIDDDTLDHISPFNSYKSPDLLVPLFVKLSMETDDLTWRGIPCPIQLNPHKSLDSNVTARANMLV